MPAQRNKTEDDITAEVLQRFAETPDPRLRQIMLGLVKHLHAFVKEVELTEAEWFQAIEILTEAGRMCSDKRQEFILFSDTLGVSMVVDLIEPSQTGWCHRVRRYSARFIGSARPNCRPAATSLISTKPARRPWSAAGCSTSTASRSKAPCSMFGRRNRAVSTIRRMRASTGCTCAGKFRTDAEGRYLVRTVRPVNYPIPSDGPVGRMLRATGRHPWRPAHIHFVVSADGYEPVTTHIFDRTDEYLGSDAVFAVKDSLICDFERHDSSTGEAARLGIDPPFLTAEFDFHLKPASEQGATVLDAQQRLAALGAAG